MACVVYGARPRDPSAPARYSTGMKLIEQSLLDTLTASASSAPRGRAHHNVHANASDPVQRFFVVADQRSYFRPHRHLVRSELALIVRGADTARPDIAPEAAGLHAVSLGLSALAGDDDHGLLKQGFVIYDALFAWLRFAADERHNWPAKVI